MSKTMKDSGIPWIGEIPSHWIVQRLQTQLYELNEKNNPVKTDFVLSLTNTRGVIPYTEKGDVGNKAKENHEDYKIAYPNTIVANSMNILIGSVGICNYYGCVSPVYYILKERVGTDLRFYNYILSCVPFQKHLRQYANGILEIRLRLSCKDILQRSVPTPSYKEQQSIADFLDKKCSEIDEMVSLQEKIVEELKAYKQSVITETVCKGLNPDVPMKDSGIEWVESIPSHWEVKKVKYLANTITKGSGITKEEVFVNGDTPCVRYGEIYSRYGNSFRACISATNIDIQTAPRFFYKGDILCAGTGELVEEIGKSTVYLGEERCLAGGDIIVINHNQNPVFLNFALNSNYAQTQKSKGKAKLKVVHISSSEIGSVLIALPPLEEQQAIADYLDKKCTEIDTLISVRQAKIDALKEFKKSIIYEYITGKKEING